MKLKKLMPLGVIVGLTTSVTPLVTSCGTKNWNETYTWDNTKEKPTLEPKTPESYYYMNWSECMDAYLKDVSDNHALLANDIMYSNWYQDGIDDNSEDVDSVPPVTKKDITSMSIVLNNIDLKSHKLSFVNEFTWEPVDGNDDEKTTEKYVVSNMEYVIRSMYDQRYESYNTINIIAPTVWMEVFILIQDGWKGEYFKGRMQEIINNEIENLSKDHSWYVEVPSSAPINGELTFEKINYKNIKEIGAFGFWWKVLPLTIATTYYKNAKSAF